MNRAVRHLDWFISINLAVIGGYVDTVGFVALSGLFTAHVTGNFILIASELIGIEHGIWIKLMIFPAFILGVILTRLITLVTPEKNLTKVILLEALFLFAAMIFGLAAPSVHPIDSLPGMMAGLLAAIAMGMQTTQGRLVLIHASPTTVMTGNITEAVINLVDILVVPSRREKWLSRIHLIFTLSLIASFAIGAILGAFAFYFFSFWALVLPVLQLAFTAYLVQRFPLHHSLPQ